MGFIMAGRQFLLSHYKETPLSIYSTGHVVHNVQFNRAAREWRYKRPYRFHAYAPLGQQNLTLQCKFSHQARHSRGA